MPMNPNHSSNFKPLKPFKRSSLHDHGRFKTHKSIKVLDLIVFNAYVLWFSNT